MASSITSTPQSYLGTASDSVSAAVAREDVHIIHELGIGGTGNIVTESKLIAPSDRPTLVSVRSEVTRSSRAMSSPAYLATIRRRHMTWLSSQIAGLARTAAGSELPVHTFPIIERIRDVLTSSLADADTEGNSKEILRRIRDSFLNGGFESYRRDNVRAEVSALLADLGRRDEVTSAEVDGTYQTFRSLGLSVPCLEFVEDGEEFEESAD